MSGHFKTSQGPQKHPRPQRVKQRKWKHSNFRRRSSQTN